MARSLSQSKRLAALVVDALSLPLHRRGYAGAVSSVSGGLGRTRMVGKVEDTSVSVSVNKQGSASEVSSAWVPDPVTGYYRPINHSAEIDPAELRQVLLNHKLRSHHPTQ